MEKQSGTQRAAHSVCPGGPPAADRALGYEELLRAYDALQEEHRRRTVALATAAHELKTPLAVMGGYLDVLLSQSAGPLNKKQLRILKDMRANRERLHHFIDDFLTFSALETGKLNMNFELADPNACLSEVCSLWLPRFKEKQVALYFPASDKLRPFRFDYYKTQRVASNLLENSLKYTPAGGSVWLTAEPYFWERRGHQKHYTDRERRRQPAGAPNCVRVTVSDTGIGIDPEFQQEIFGEFVRHPDPDNQSEGTGLGLAICRRLIQAHGGKIWLESERGCGSKFTFLLPLTPG